MTSLIPDKHRARLACCRPDRDDLGCKRTREALGRVEIDAALREAFAAQVEIDAPTVARIQALPLPWNFEQEIQAGLRGAARPIESTWGSLCRQPALWAVFVAVAFLAAWGGWMVYERATGFPGDDAIRQLVTETLHARGLKMEPLDTECGKLGDTLFLRHNLADYEVPAAFTREAMAAYRVFEKNDSPITQIQAREDGLMFLVFRADVQGVDISPEGSWKYLDGDGWTAAAIVHNHICFVAVNHGARTDLDSRLRVAKN